MDSQQHEPLHNLAQIQHKIIAWYLKERPRNFLWRDFIFSENEIVYIDNVGINRKFAIFIAEFFLIRTKAEQVEPVYKEFLKIFNSFSKIVKGDIETFTSIFGSLGLHRRINQLLLIAQQFQDRELPDSYDDLLKIPGVGQYVAAAFSCFANRQRIALIDSNFVRIYTRLFGIKENTEIRRNRNFVKLCNSVVPDDLFREYNLSLLDIGALICKTIPECQKCPLNDVCQFYIYIRLLIKSKQLIVLPIFDQNGIGYVFSMLKKLLEENKDLFIFIQVKELGVRVKRRYLKEIKSVGILFPDQIGLDIDIPIQDSIEPGLLVDDKLFILKYTHLNDVLVGTWAETPPKIRKNWITTLEKIKQFVTQY